MRYVVYGAGAIGGILGGRLHLAGNPVTLIARGEHLRAIQEHGLRLDTGHGERVVTAPACNTAADVQWTEDTVVLLSVKSQQTAVALADLVAHAPSSVSVVAVQNGLANEPAILRHFANTYGMCVAMPAVHIEPGVVVERAMDAPAVLEIGRYPGGIDHVAQQVAADLSAAGLPAEPRENVMAWKRRKLMRNLNNGVDAVCAPSDAARELSQRCQQEGQTVMQAAGFEMVTVEEDAQRRRGLMGQGRPGMAFHSSTWQSLSRGVGDIEIDYLSGEIVLQGRLHGVPTPANELMVQVVNEVVRNGGAANSLDAQTLLDRLDAAALPMH